MIGTLRARIMERRQQFAIHLGKSKISLEINKSAGQFVVGLPLPPPAKNNLQKLRMALAEVQRKGHPATQWPLGLLRASGWIILDALADRNHVPSQTINLVNEPELFSHYLTALGERGGVLGGRILLYSYLQCYPEGHPCMEPLRTLLSRLLGIATDSKKPPVSNLLATTPVYHGLLAFNGPAILAHHLLSTDPGSYLAKIGLSGELARGRFVEAIWRRLAKEMATGSGSCEAEFSPVLRVFLGLSLDNNGTKLRFPERVTDLAEAMLKPWIGKGIKLPLGIRNLLLHHLGDPRMASIAWDGVSDASLEVMRQHLAGETIEDFFTLLETIAVRDAMVDRYRRQFHSLWESCRVQGALTDAWLAIGPSLLADAHRCLGIRTQHYAGLDAPTGTRARQAVLLLRIAGVTVVEWSHGGSYYLWHPNNAATPQCYQSHYTYESLEREPNLHRPRHNAHRGDWRVELFHHIAMITGIPLEESFLDDPQEHLPPPTD